MIAACRLPSTPSSSLAGWWQSRKLDHPASQSCLLPDLQSVHAVQSCGGIRYGWGTNGAKDRQRGGQEDRGTTRDQRAGEVFGRGEEWREMVMLEHRRFMNSYRWDVWLFLLLSQETCCYVGRAGLCNRSLLTLEADSIKNIKKANQSPKHPKQMLQVRFQDGGFSCKSLPHRELWLFRGQGVVREGPDLCAKHHMVRLFLQLCYMETVLPPTARAEIQTRVFVSYYGDPFFSWHVHVTARTSSCGRWIFLSIKCKRKEPVVSMTAVWIITEWLHWGKILQQTYKQHLFLSKLNCAPNCQMLMHAFILGLNKPEAV